MQLHCVAVTALVLHNVIMTFCVQPLRSKARPNDVKQPPVCPKGPVLDEILITSEESANTLNKLAALLEGNEFDPQAGVSSVFPEVKPSSTDDPSKILKDMENMGRTLEVATRFLSRANVKVNARTLATTRMYKDLFNKCQTLYPLHCNVTHRYRTMDGSCNNPIHKHRGRSVSCQSHLLVPSFQDGISMPRSAKSGKALPLARAISTQLLHDQDKPSHLNNFFQHFAQVIAHDLVSSSIPTSVAGSFLNCCLPLNQSLHPECGFTISLPKHDPFYSHYQQTCQLFGRALPCAACKTGPRSPTNLNTAFLDLSQVYGSDDATAHTLRGPRGELLTDGSRLNLLPESSRPELDSCSKLQTNGMKCFHSGDIRLNQQTFLVAIATMLMRNHNHLARSLKKLNPEWSDESVFQESRRINTAMMQMITYSEVLPLILGPEYTSYFQLEMEQQGHTSYDSNIDPGITTEFAAAAFRGLHSLIASRYHLYYWNETVKDIRLRDMYRNPKLLREGNYDAIIRGLLIGQAQKFDRFFSEDVSNFLTRVLPNPFGDDLTSFDIQRGRDVGLQPYVEMLEFCFQKKINQFSELSEFMSEGNWNLLQDIYEHIRDIDLFVGGSMEDALEGGALGPTFGCIVGKQFHALRFGDRFYFEHKGEVGSFTEEQLKEIRKVTMASIMCKAFDDTQKAKVLKNPFFIHEETNPEIDCKDIPYISLDPWKE